MNYSLMITVEADLNSTPLKMLWKRTLTTLHHHENIEHQFPYMVALEIDNSLAYSVEMPSFLQM